MILYGLVVVIHLIAAVVLISVILLQAGRGGGLSEAFGGSSTQTIFGTKASSFLVRATAACAIVYLFTCLTLAVMTARRGRSLMATQKQELPVLPAMPGMPGGAEGPAAPKIPEVPKATPITEPVTPEAEPVPTEAEPLTPSEE